MSSVDSSHSRSRYYRRLSHELAAIVERAGGDACLTAGAEAALWAIAAELAELAELNERGELRVARDELLADLRGEREE